MVTSAATSHPLVWRSHPHLYEINTWPWLEKLSERAGRQITLGKVPDSEWDSFAQLGFDIVWLMGIWQRSAKSRQIALTDPAHLEAYARVLPSWTPSDIVGSPYSIQQYVPDVRMGTWDDVDQARERLRERNMALFLDFVGNHTALDHPWTHDHPEFYVQGTKNDFDADPGSFFQVETPQGPAYLAHGRDPYFPPWTDTAQLNHFSGPMRAAQIDDLRNIARHCDGVRCDMAMLHLRDIFSRVWGRFLKDETPPEKEFWQEAHEALPQLTLLAEAYWGTEERLLELGFSFVYDKALYDAVRDTNIENIKARLSGDVRRQGRFARFLENHDEASSLDVFGKQRLPCAEVLMGTLPGMRFYYQDELEGCTPHFPITLRVPPNQPPDQFCMEMFSRILRFANEAVFHQGDWQLLPTSPAGDSTFTDLVVYEWRLGGVWKVIAVNLKPAPAQGYVHLGASILNSKNYIFYDQLHHVRYPRKGNELAEMGLFVRLEGFQAHLFDVSGDEVTAGR